MITKRFICVALNASLCIGTLGLAACNNQSPPSAPAPSSTAPAPASTAPNAPSAYTPPSADQLYQLVAPIALFPDKLVAQVLAGSTYPDQVTAADDLLAKNSNLKGALLQTAIDPQPWDPSVKGLTAFPSVLDQMAKNIQWTTALGTAYVNDPTDVMNAIQVMRQRASKNGSLVSNSKQKLVTTPVTATTTVTTQTETDYPPTYSGPEVVPAPQETIQIEPAESDVVYVPSYNPETVYGDAVPYYPGYAYSPGYSTGDVVVAGAIGFGAGILIANLFDHHDDRSWGWNSWGMRWGHGGGYHDGGYDRGGWTRPAVVHNDNVYVSRSNTVINRYTTNNVTNNNRYVNNSVNYSNNNNNNRENFNRTVQNNNPNNPNNPNNENRRFDPRENLANRAAANEGPRAPNTLRPGPVSQAAQPRAEARGPMTTPNFQNAMQHDQRIQAMRGGATPAQAAGEQRTAAAEAARTSQRMQPFDARQQQANEARARQESRIENTPRENPGAQRLPVAPSFHAAAPEAARQQQPRQDMQQEQQQRAAAMQQRQQMMERQAQQPRPEPQQQRMQQQERREMPQQQQRVQQQPRQEQHAAQEHHAAPAEHGKRDDNHH